MNTCAECRFWKKDSLVHDTAFGNERDFGECDRSRANYHERAERMTVVPYGGHLHTRSDFGCVQFEPRTTSLSAIPVGEPRTTSSTGEYPTSMRCGTCKTVWDPKTQKHYCPGMVLNLANETQAAPEPKIPIRSFRLERRGCPHPEHSVLLADKLQAGDTFTDTPSIAGYYDYKLTAQTKDGAVIDVPISGRTPPFSVYVGPGESIEIMISPTLELSRA